MRYKRRKNIRKMPFQKEDSIHLTKKMAQISQKFLKNSKVLHRAICETNKWEIDTKETKSDYEEAPKEKHQ